MKILVNLEGDIIGTNPVTDGGYFVTDQSHVFKDSGLSIVTVPDGFTMDGEYTYLNGAVIKKATQVNPIDVPQSITPVQARLALLNAGLYDAATTAISNLAGADKARAEIEWEYATLIHRDNFFITTVASLLSLTSNQVDNLFIEAAKL